MTLSLVSTITVDAGGAASIEFTGIPQTGTDLLLQISGRSNVRTSPFGMQMTLNGDTGTNYSNKLLNGTGSAASSGGYTGTFGYYFAGNAMQGGSGTTTNTFGSISIYFPNYASSSAKAFSVDAVTENNATAANQSIHAGSWTGTAAINKITIFGSTIIFDQYSVLSLYTITKGSGGATVA